jgi:hypothetical protein
MECEKLSLLGSFDELNALQAELEMGQIKSPEGLDARVNGIINLVRKELFKTCFGFIPTQKVEYFKKDNAFGPAVSLSLPSAAVEIKEAGTCLAGDLNTAAIFHLMRAAEIGLRALARHLKVSFPRRGGIEYAEWGRILDGIENKVDLIRQRPRSQKKTEDLEFYSGVLGEFYAFKDVWRNNVMHTRRDYNETDAFAVYQHVRGFLQRLAERVQEP